MEATTRSIRAHRLDSVPISLELMQDTRLRVAKTEEILAREHVPAVPRLVLLDVNDDYLEHVNA